MKGFGNGHLKTLTGEQADLILTVKVKVKQSRYRPGVAQKVPGSYGSQIS
jgi:hypothetical protein